MKTETCNEIMDSLKAYFLERRVSKFEAFRFTNIVQSILRSLPDWVKPEDFMRVVEAFKEGYESAKNS